MSTSLATLALLAAQLEFVVPDANFSLREGLPAVQILSLYQDDGGSLWVGTSSGLAQLGGPSIQVFGPEVGLLRSAVLAISEDPTGALVVGTASGILRLVGNHFEPVRVPAAAAQLAVRRFARARDGTLWALAGDRIILRYAAAGWHAVGIDGAFAFEATDLAVDQNGGVWLATRNHGVLWLAPSGTRLQKAGAFQADRNAVTTIDHIAASGDTVYFSSTRGLSSMSVAAGGVVETVPFPEGASVGSRAVTVTPGGRVYVGTNAGVFTLQARTLAPVESRNDRARAPITCLLPDREGQLWTGTTEGGLNLLLQGRGVRFLRTAKESLRSIFVDQRGAHWVSNERRVLTFRTDSEGNPISARSARFEGFDSLTIAGIADDPEGGLAFATGGGVGLLTEAARDSDAPLVRRHPRFEVLRDRLVSGIYRDRQDAMWAISPLGVYRLARGAREAESVSISSGDAWTSAMDSGGALWVATRQGALEVIETSTQTATPVKLPAGELVEFVGPSPDGGVIATFASGASGFFVLGANGEVVSSPGPEGLSWLSVHSILKMGGQYLAAHGGDRLSQLRLRPTRIEQTILTSADLEDADFRYLSLREGRAGQIWFTLLSGVGLFDPPNAPPPPNRLRLVPGEPSFRLGPRPNLLDLHAQLSDPVAPNKARYRYRFGDSQDWSAWTSDPHIPLANVAPGAYQLEVEGQDRYGRVPASVRVDIVAAAHLWESWPARITAFVLGIAVLTRLYQRRMRAIERERLALAEAVRVGRADLEIANQRLQEISITDTLTGLKNRRYFSEVVVEELRLLERRFKDRPDASGNSDALFFLLDLDRFKSVNDMFGHASGDAVLVETARRLRALLRKTDRLIRWGGEEFLGVSLDCRRTDAPDMAARIMDAITREPYALGSQGGVHLTVSIGWAAYPFMRGEKELTPEEVVGLADRALYVSKDTGRNRATGIAPVDEDGRVGPSPAEFIKELGLTVTFTRVLGPEPAGQTLVTFPGTGAHRRLS